MALIGSTEKEVAERWGDANLAMGRDWGGRGSPRVFISEVSELALWTRVLISLTPKLLARRTP